MRPTPGTIGSSRYLSLVLTIAGLALAAGPVLAADPTPFGENLLRNPGAESGTPGPTVPKWETDLDFQTAAYGASGMPRKKESKAIDGGAQLFYSGPYSMQLDACGTALQYVKLRKRAADIDSGNVRVSLSAFLGTKAATDTATVTLQFRDGNNHQIGNQLTLGPVSSQLELFAESASRKVPAKTRIFRVQLLGNAPEQTCDAFFDNVSVVINLR